DRRRAEDDEPAGCPEVRRGFEGDVAAEAPADDDGAARAGGLGEAGEHLRVAGQGVVLGVAGFRRVPVAGQVEGQAAEALAERALHDAAPGAGGAGVPVHEDDGPFGSLALPERDPLAIDGDLLLVHPLVPFPHPWSLPAQSAHDTACAQQERAARRPGYGRPGRVGQRFLLATRGRRWRWPSQRSRTTRSPTAT